MDKFYLTGVINDYIIQEMCDYINAKQGEESITIYVDSPGGDVFAGLRAIKAINNSQTPVIAECGVVVASIASVIALSCPTIKINKDTFMMIHKPWVEMAGTAEELLSTASLLDQAGTNIINIVKFKAKDESVVDDWFAAPETWFGAAAIMDNFKDVIMDEKIKIDTKVIEIGNCLKKAPKELLTLVAQLKDSEPKTKEPDQEPTNIVDNAIAKEILAKCKEI